MYSSYGWKKPKPKTTPRRQPKAMTRLYRVPAAIKREKNDEIMYGRIFLVDLSPSGVGIFLPEPLAKDEIVTLVIEHPRHIYVKGTISFCGLYTLHTAVLSPESFAYRAYIKFVFDSPEEREALRKFVL